MSSQQKTVDYLLDQLKSAGTVSGRKMFGEYGLYLDGKLFALVCDDQLFIKPTPAGRDYAQDLTEGVPYPSAKPCLLVSGDKWDDAEWLVNLARITARSLPEKGATSQERLRKAKDR